MISHVSRFWVVCLVFVGLVLCLVGFLVWDSYQRPLIQQPVKQPIVSDSEDKRLKNNSSSEGVSSSSPQKNINPSLPAPAKKLQQLINDEDVVTDDKVLADRLSALDKQLEELNQQLEKQGSILPQAAPDPQSNESNTQDPTAERLDAIRTFLNEKDSGQNK